ncbi:DUF2637 domain-containing protein [Streptomyces sp. NPDC007920]|uniref:DUF2637 domain-containing protein n=1 Tax=Streptomyces sp. NPDC007920 TaxID=3364794 RepID=UPI0036F0D3D4
MSPNGDRIQLTPLQRRLVIAVVAGAVLIALIGFVGSYAAVRELAKTKGFGDFANAFPIGIDAGILVLLALDLLLTWLRMPLAMLRHTAWALTGATIAFNAATAWPDPIGTGMHAAMPVLFVVVVEAARHATGQAADITAGRHMDSIRTARWLLDPIATFRLWRRMKLWELRSYDEVIGLERQRRVEQARLRARYGRRWRSKAPVQAVMALRLTRYGRALAPVKGVLDIEPQPVDAPVLALANTQPAAIEPPSTFEAAAEQAIDVVREDEQADHEQPITVASNPNTVREHVANKAVTSPNADREPEQPAPNNPAPNTGAPSIAALVRDQIAASPNNADIVRAVLEIRPDADKDSVAATVRRERRKSQMQNGYG